MSWQRANIQTAATYLRELIGKGAIDPRAKGAYEGLLEVLDPARRAVRIQRENAAAARATAPVPVARERRHRTERRELSDRRQVDLGSPTGVERRKGARRTGQDRRH